MLVFGSPNYRPWPPFDNIPYLQHGYSNIVNSCVDSVALLEELKENSLPELWPATLLARVP
jgi:hypothetical protein